MRLIFARHAESTGNAEGRLQGYAEYELTEDGVAQAHKLHERFQRQGFEPTHIYSSPLKRTAATAQIACRSWSLPISYWDSLKEHDVGIFSGLTWDEIEAKYPKVAKEYQRSRNWDVVTGAESLGDRRTRAQHVVDTVLGRHTNDDRVLLFTHGGILQHMLAALMGTDRTWGISISNTGVFDFTLDLERWSQDGPGLLNNFHWRIVHFNDDAHLG